jgi:protein SCO1/2
MHGDAVYIFDTQGRARLLATSADPEEALAEDLRDLLPS